MHDPLADRSPPDAPIPAGRSAQRRRRTVVLVAVAAVTTGLVTPALAVPAGATPNVDVNSTATTSSPPSKTGTPTPSAASPTPSSQHQSSPGSSDSANTTGNASSNAGCTGKGPIQRGICNAIEDAKRDILGGALTATQDLTRSTLELILRRPAPRRSGELTVFRPPTNQPLSGAYTGWTAVGLPLGFMVWTIGVGVALASRFRPRAEFAFKGFQIEENLARNLFLVIGSWWVGAFVLHLANALILAVAPRGEQLITGPQSGVGNVLATGGIVGVFWAATAAVATILLVATVIAYFLCLAFMEFLPVFSALMLFDTGGVLGTIGGFGRTGWEIFIKAAFFPLPAAFVLGAGTFIAGGTMGYVERAVAIGGFAEIAGTLAFAVIMFVTLLTALIASLWMLLGSRAASTAGGVVAGLGGAALYSQAKSRVKTLGGNVPTPGGGSSAGAAGSMTDVTAGAGGQTDPLAGSPLSRGGASGSGGTLGAGADAASALGGGSPDADVGGLTPTGVPTGGRPSTGISDSTTTHTSSAPGDSTGSSARVGAGGGERGHPIGVQGEGDLPAGQHYQPGFVSDGEFQPVKPQGRNREMLIREHDRFAQRYDAEGDHRGIYLRGEDDGRLYDASPVAGEDWGMSPSEEAKTSRDAVYDTRNGGGGSR